MSRQKIADWCCRVVAGVQLDNHIGRPNGDVCLVAAEVAELINWYAERQRNERRLQAFDWLRLQDDGARSSSLRANPS